MCGHDWKNVNEVKVCTKCGLTMPDGGRPFFDKKIISACSAFVKYEENLLHI